jgi:GNAT superfamily N-acetyltransferase
LARTAPVAASVIDAHPRPNRQEVGMSSIEIRPFNRSDREQLTVLVNAHVEAVVPGVSISVNAVMSQLEREPGEYVVDPWVLERETLVAERQGRVVAAAHVLRYATDDRVGDAYRNVGEIRWLVAWPDEIEAGERLAQACLETLSAWRVGRRYADGSLPAPGVYGVPACWPHVADVYRRVGFSATGQTEVVLLALVAELPGPEAPPIADLVLRRELGGNATLFTAVLGDEWIGAIEVRTDLSAGGALSRFAGWGDVRNLRVAEPYRRRGVATWLVAQAAEWLRLGGVERLLAECWDDQHDALAFLKHVGWRELTRTQRGWVHGGG